MSVAATETTIVELVERAKVASQSLRTANTATKNAALQSVAAELRRAAQEILEANALDVAAARGTGMSGALVDRLVLDPVRLEVVAASVEEVCALPDPVGTIMDRRVLANGLEIAKMRVPLGVIAIIYESRPNVTVEAGALCVKSGNACVLRGGSEAFRTNQMLAEVFAQGLAAAGLPPASVQLVPTTDRDAMLTLLKLDGLVDLVIPRGGEALIRFVAEHARVPVIRHAKGVCHVYVDRDADLDMAERIAINAKVQRPGVCNAMETLLVDRACADAFVPRVTAAMRAAGVELRGDSEVVRRDPHVKAATSEDWDAEYLDKILAIAVVDGIDGALAHVAKHGSNHTEAIVTRDSAKAERWLREVDASLVLVNASTRFNDGGQLGLGAEIGISTTRLHAYGPMGLAELCTLKWIARGQGQIRT